MSFEYVDKAYLFASSLGALAFDTIIREIHSVGNEITSYPVERGAPINDSAHRLPRQITLEIGHSGRAFSILAAFAPRTFRLQDFYEKLIVASDTHEIIELTTGLYNYPSMVIKSFQATKDKDNVTIIRVVVVLVEVIRYDVGQILAGENRFADIVSVQATETRQAARTEVTDVDPVVEAPETLSSTAFDLFTSGAEEQAAEATGAITP